ncbi:MAG TPA: hypothetical protein VGQ42_12095 [Candidatus Dormibacteraeota bacterium]|jgi:hypothetical protein|nr:hypothetical protein [Candidatus Dormibacteraeota bacterium]
MTDAERLVLPDSLSAPVAAEVKRYGTRDVETGGFLLAPEARPMCVSTVALAGHNGVTRGRGIFRISGKAIDRLFGWAEVAQLRIPAQFHSHGSEAFLSCVDRRDGFNVTEFISAVIPQYGDPPMDPHTWGWWQYDGDEWLELDPPEVIAGSVRVVVFDEDGVRAHG